MQESNVGICPKNLLSIELQDQSQHAVSSGMLRTEVHGIVPDLAIVYLFAVVGCLVHVLRLIFIYGMGESRIHRDKPCTLVVDGGLFVILRCTVVLGFRPRDFRRH